MTIRRILGGMMVAVALAACGDQGGELAEDTARRRASETGADSAGGDSSTAPAPDEPGRMPAFVLSDSSPVTLPATPAAADSAAAPAAMPGQTPAAPQEAWTAGVTDRVRTMSRPVTLRDVRVGVNQGFDRLVLEFAGSDVPGYRVEYVDRPARHCASGDPVSIAGDGLLAVTLRGTEAHDARGQVTVSPRERRLQMPLVKEYEFTCDFEGEVQVVLGVASPNRYRVTELQNPTRLIVDVQQ
ncbi:AMIN-like domain-containing (lipo)protein [Longimicrobium sp.]|uniref:AMIN-like domain-containing (lipo)protein n=1 Tax=Longimicrobium sp. TaxID=2029185 RepID=UPI002E2EF02E|nr:hypothetical protein [Longimicrobium sp.]HEX6037303.1 hypothetical protein [Longimicrobium sp.]